jgi:valyl-tRNA synthetase
MLPVKDAESIMISSYPVYDKKLYFKDTLELMECVREFITKTRIYKKENNISKDCKYTFRCSDNKEIETLICNILKLEVKNIAYQEEIDNFEKLVLDYKKNIFSANIAFYYTISEEDRNKERESLTKQKELLESQIARREKLLSNPGYVNNAPKELVEEEKNKLENEKKELETVLWKLKD